MTAVYSEEIDVRVGPGGKKPLGESDLRPGMLVVVLHFDPLQPYRVREQTMLQIAEKPDALGTLKVRYEKRGPETITTVDQLDDPVADNFICVPEKDLPQWLEHFKALGANSS